MKLLLSRLLGSIALGLVSAVAIVEAQTIAFPGGVSSPMWYFTSHAPDNATMQRLQTSLYPHGIWRDDFAMGYGALPMFYQPSVAACSLNAGAGDNATQIKSEDGKCWLARYDTTVGLGADQFGVRCDGVTDNSTTLAAWWAAMSYVNALSVPSGVCVFKTALVSPNQALNGVTINGSGYYTSVLQYAGANTTNDIVRLGPTEGSAFAYTGMTVTGFRITSATAMTGGAGLHLYHVTRSVVDPVIDGQDGSGNFYDGRWWDQNDVVSVPWVDSNATHDMERFNGSLKTDAWFPSYVDEIHFGHGKIACASPNATATGHGVHLTGGVGGLTFDAVDIIGCFNNLLADASFTATGNQGATFGSNTFLDTSENGGDNIVLDDGADCTWCGNKLIEFDGSIASCAASCLNIVHWNDTGRGAAGDILLRSIQVSGAATDGILYQDTGARLLIAGGTRIFFNTGDGINATVTPPVISLASGTLVQGNGTDLSPNVLNSLLPLYTGQISMATPVALGVGGVTAGVTYVAGATGLRSYYQLTGMMVDVDYTMQITGLGGNTGGLTLEHLPIGAAASAAVGGGGTVTYATNWNGLTGGITASTDSLGGTFANLNQPIGSGIAVVTDANLAAIGVGNPAQLWGHLRYFRP